MPTKKKSPKQDPKLVSKEKYERDYILKRAGKNKEGKKLTAGELKVIVARVGKSRTKIYSFLRTQGFDIKTRKFKK